MNCSLSAVAYLTDGLIRILKLNKLEDPFLVDVLLSSILTRVSRLVTVA